MAAPKRAYQGPPAPKKKPSAKATAKPKPKAPDHRAGYRPGGGPGKSYQGPPRPRSRTGGGNIDLPQFAREVSDNYARGAAHVGNEIGKAARGLGGAFGHGTKQIDNVMKLPPKKKR